MLGLGAPELILIIVAILLLFGYKKLPDASRSLGRSLRIFKGEMKGMKDDDLRDKQPAATSAPLRGDVFPPAAPTDLTAESAARAQAATEAAALEAEARAAEARAAELRAQAARAADASR